VNCDSIALREARCIPIPNLARTVALCDGKEEGVTYPDLLAELDHVRAYQRRVAAAIEAKNQELAGLIAQHDMAQHREGEITELLHQMEHRLRPVGTIVF
jgi:hypothetical protein